MIYYCAIRGKLLSFSHTMNCLAEKLQTMKWNWIEKKTFPRAVPEYTENLDNKNKNFVFSPVDRLLSFSGLSVIFNFLGMLRKWGLKWRQKLKIIIEKVDRIAIKGKSFIINFISFYSVFHWYLMNWLGLFYVDEDIFSLLIKTKLSSELLWSSMENPYLLLERFPATNESSQYTAEVG